MRRYWVMIAREAWRENLAELRRVRSAAFGAAVVAGILVVLGIGTGAVSLGFIGGAVILLGRFVWSLLSIPARLHKVQQAAESRGEVAGALERLLKEGHGILEDSAAGSEPWVAEMLDWEGRVLLRLRAFDQSERVPFETIGSAVPEPGTVAYANQVIERLEAKLAKLRLIVGRAYASKPNA